MRKKEKIKNEDSVDFQLEGIQSLLKTMPVEYHDEAYRKLIVNLLDELSDLLVCYKELKTNEDFEDNDLLRRQAFKEADMEGIKFLKGWRMNIEVDKVNRYFPYPHCGDHYYPIVRKDEWGEIKEYFRNRKRKNKSEKLL